MSEPIVNVAEGKLKGIVEHDNAGNRFYSFKGIPYAEPPIGKFRFKASIPVKPWNDIRDANKDGKPSVQLTATGNIIGSEDCLFLNVFTPNLPIDVQKIDRQYLKPVMVYVHGGYFIMGSNKSHVFGPHFLMTKDVILVTVNYRLGLLGTLNCEDENLDIPGNAAFKDLVLALKWIRNNIINFSGDPDNITVVGQSSGASVVHFLLLSPLTKGLIHKVILQSGSAFLAALYAKSLKQLAFDMGLPSKIEQQIISYLTNASIEDLLQIQKKLELRYPSGNCKGVVGLTIEKPHENAFLTESPVKIIHSRTYPKVPILMGYTYNEGTVLDVMLQRCELPLDIYWSRIEQLVPHFWNINQKSPLYIKTARRLIEYYFPTESSRKNPKRSVNQVYKDVFIRAMLQAADAHSQTGPVFLYKMEIETELNTFKTLLGIQNPEIKKEKGAIHGDDLGYLFHTYVTPKIEPHSIEDVSQQRFLRMWTNFAKFGNPIPACDPFMEVEWNETNPESLRYLNIGTDLKMLQNPDQEMMTFWDSIEAFSSPSKL